MSIGPRTPDFPLLTELDFAPSPIFSDDPGAWVDELQGVEFANLEGHNFLRMRQGDYDIVVSTPRISDHQDGPPLLLSVIAMGLTFLVIGYFLVQWLIRPIRTIRAGAAEIGQGNFGHRIEMCGGISSAIWPVISTRWQVTSKECWMPSVRCYSASVMS